MESFRLGNLFPFLGKILFLFFTFAVPVQAFPFPIDPSESTAGCALLVSNPEGSIHGAKAKLNPFNLDALGAGELRAHLQYELATASGESSLKYAVSKPAPTAGMNSSAESPTEFDFSENPVSKEANPVGLKIYHHESSRSLPLLIAEYGPDQLLMEEKEIPSQTPPPLQGGVLLWGPVTFLRERAKPKTEQVSIPPISEPTGPFLLRLTNGTAEGTRRVSSAGIKLNGQEVFRPSEFNQQVEELRRQVILLSGENLLEVNLRSAPGAFATLELFRLEKQACRIYDFHTFRRSKGKPVIEVDVFELGPQFEGPYTLNLSSGNTDGTQRVDSAVINLNGASVFEPNDFNEQVGFLSRIVPLQSANTLSVELRGAPGDFLTIGITGYDDIPPRVTITSPKDGEIFTEGPITVSGTVNDPLASVTINGILVSVAADGSFTLKGVNLAEEENMIQAAAVDTCGNKDEDQITVILSPAQEGPLLSFCVGSSLPTIAARAADCRTEAFTRGFGQVRGTTDRTTTELILDGISLPREGSIEGKGNMDWGWWDGTSFEALLNIPGLDEIYPITATAKNATGGKTEAIVTFVKDTTPPAIAITLPKDGWVTNTRNFTVAGTVDDPQATIYGGWDYSPIPIFDGVFTAEAVLNEEGPNYVSINAFDPAWNASEAVIWVTLDTIYPKLKISNPADGMAVNSAILTINGEIIDEAPEGVSVAVNGGPSNILALNGINFSGTVPLSAGINTLTFTATDRAGNASQSAQAVVLDMEPPYVAITSPAAGANVSGMITLTVNASDAVAGIASVTLLIDGQYLTTLTQAPFSHSVDTSNFPLGSHTITARGMDRAGNQAETTASFSVSRIMIEIVSPANGATVNKSRAIVKGKIHNQPGEIGVLVNGILAEVQGDDFAVVVPLRIGQNMVTATAAAAGGLQVQTSVTITTERQEENVRLTVYPGTGILKLPANLLNVVFEAETYLQNPVVSSSWDFDGDGNPEISGTEFQITGQYQKPGLYFPRVTVTDDQGNAYTETGVVNVLSREEMDSLLRSKWEGMKGRLLEGDVDGAMDFFNDSKKEAYRRLLKALAAHLPAIVSEMSDIQLIEYTANAVIYDLRTFRKGEAYSFPIIFEKDINGIWRITSF